MLQHDNTPKSATHWMNWLQSLKNSAYTEGGHMLVGLSYYGRKIIERFAILRDLLPTYPKEFTELSRFYSGVLWLYLQDSPDPG